MKIFGRTLAMFVLAFYVFANGAAMLHPKALWSDRASHAMMTVDLEGRTEPA